MINFNNGGENKHVSYRKDIDGLRAVAVLFVIAFHIWPKLFTGGFVGVDIFFTISGFLITSIINRELGSGHFSFRGFYARRIKRILPVFYLVVLSTTVIAWRLLLPNDFMLFIRSLMYSVCYASNIFFGFTKSYFETSANSYPLLHTWSLSVEEQYYFIWPVVLYGINKFYNNVRLKLLISIIIFLLSLVLSIYLSSRNNALAYYTVITRSFELMIGSILAIITGILSNKSHLLINNNKSGIFGVIGLLVIVYSAITINEYTPYPSYYALLPTVGTAMVIFAGVLNPNNVVSRILSARLFVFIGLISYSLYMWHWPILAFLHYYYQEIPNQLNFIAVFATFVLSIGSYFLVEIKIKTLKMSFVKLVSIFLVLPIMLIASLYFITMRTNGIPSRLDRKIQLQSIYLDKQYCQNQIVGSCIFGDTNKIPTKVLLFGDSHAGSLSPFWNDIAKKNGFSIKIISTDSCYPLLDTRNRLPSHDPLLYSPKKCRAQIEYISEHVDDYNVFILAGAWHKYLLNGENTPKDFLFTDELINTLSFLQKKHKAVLIHEDLPLVMNGNVNSEIKLMNLRHTNDTMKFSVQENNTNIVIDNIARRFDNVSLIKSSWLIDGIHTYPYYNNLLLYKDNDHLNQYGSEVLAQEFLSSYSGNNIVNKIKANE